MAETWVRNPHIEKTETGFTVRADVRQVNAEDVKVRVEDGVLIISVDAESPTDVAPNFAGAKHSVETDGEGTVHREDVVAEASDMSFPASDPPAWTPGKPGGATD